MKRPETNEYAPYYEKYISLIADGTVMHILELQIAEYREMFANVSEDKGLYRYDVGKWTCKESLSHIIDAERIFSYRLLRISRGDTTPIEGFEQDDYINNSNANSRTFADLIDEFEHQRRANICLAASLTDEATRRKGTASDNMVSARALVYMMAGHVKHHSRIFAESYLK